MKSTLLTEQDSNYHHLEKMELGDILKLINGEDATVVAAVTAALQKIEALAVKVAFVLQEGGRLFYIGAGTSGRLGIVDASECPPTFGVPHGMVVGIIAGGDAAIRQAVEGAEDNTQQGFEDLKAHHINENDIVVGISASGQTPYVLNALMKCRKEQITTGCIVCNTGSPMASIVDFPIEVITGPEFVTGSTRMKAGTAQKMILNMISTAAMIKMGRVEGNKMVHMPLSNAKLMARGIQIVAQETGLTEEASKALLQKCDYHIAVALAEFRGNKGLMSPHQLI